MKKKVEYLQMSIVIIFVLFSILYLGGNIGVARSRIEKDARTAHKIDDRWDAVKSTTDTMSAMLFYDESFKDCTVSIYVNKKGFSYGYFFRGGGSLLVDDKDIANYQIEGYHESAYISMNRQQITRMEISNGDIVETINIDSKNPFSIIVANNQGIIKFYDINGYLVEPIKVPL